MTCWPVQAPRGLGVNKYRSSHRTFFLGTTMGLHKLVTWMTRAQTSVSTQSNQRCSGVPSYTSSSRSYLESPKQNDSTAPSWRLPYQVQSQPVLYTYQAGTYTVFETWPIDRVGSTRLIVRKPVISLDKTFPSRLFPVVITLLWVKVAELTPASRHV